MKTGRVVRWASKGSDHRVIHLTLQYEKYDATYEIRKGERLSDEDWQKIDNAQVGSLLKVPDEIEKCKI